jgi:hypothetical protein
MTPRRSAILSAGVRDMADSVTYLYCIVHASKTPSTSRAPNGLPGATRPATAPIAPSFWLVTASVPRETYGRAALKSSLQNVEWVTDVALAHEGVVEHFARQPGATVIPMKLLTMFSSEKRAVEEVRPRLSDLERVVDRIAGCEEWGVRITRRPVTDITRHSSTVVSGTQFLAKKKAARDDIRRAGATAAESAEHAFATLAAIAREARRRHDVPEGATVPPLLDAAFLVGADERRQFKAAVKKLANASDTTLLTLTGPWPSYNFIDSESQA